MLLYQIVTGWPAIEAFDPENHELMNQLLISSHQANAWQ
jgi:hypothetical protein